MDFITQLIAVFQEYESIQSAFIHFLHTILHSLKQSLLTTTSVFINQTSIITILNYYFSIISQPSCSPLLYNQIHEELATLLFEYYLTFYQPPSSISSSSLSYQIIILQSPSHFDDYAGFDLFSIYQSLLTDFIHFNQTHSSYPLLVDSSSFFYSLLQLSIMNHSLQPLLDLYNDLYSTLPLSSSSPFHSLSFHSSYPLLSLASFLPSLTNIQFIQSHYQDLIVFWRDCLAQKRLSSSQEIAFQEQIILFIGKNPTLFLEPSQFHLLLEILFPFLLSNQQSITSFIAIAFLPLIDRNQVIFEYQYHSLSINVRKSFFFNIVQNTAIPEILMILSTIQLRSDYFRKYSYIETKLDYLRLLAVTSLLNPSSTIQLLHQYLGCSEINMNEIAKCTNSIFREWKQSTPIEDEEINVIQAVVCMLILNSQMKELQLFESDWTKLLDCIHVLLGLIETLSLVVDSPIHTNKQGEQLLRFFVEMIEKKQK